MTQQVDRREFLKMAGIAGGAGLAGCYTRDDTDAALIGGGGPEPVVSKKDGITLIYAQDYADAKSVIDAPPAIAWTADGSVYTFGTTRVSITMSDVALHFGATSYSDAKDMASDSSLPAVVYDTNGNDYRFTET